MSSRRSDAPPGPWPYTFDDLVAAVREEVASVLRSRLTVTHRMAERHGVGATVAAIETLMRRGGKRYRAALAVAGFAAADEQAVWKPAMEAGAALELLHAYLLIQDDWMDDDDTRRGGPSVHVILREAYGDTRLGAASALLASDLAWGLSMRIMAELDAAPSRRTAALSALLRFHQEVIVGQQLDLLTEHRAGAVVEQLAQRSTVETVHRLKTASYTVAAPLVVGACLAGAEQPLQDELELFARPLGIAFQLQDDLKGVFGDPRETGKGRAGDLRAGKRTAVTEAASDALDDAGKSAFDAVLGVADASAEDLARAVAELERCGVRAAVEARLADRCVTARERLAAMALSDRCRSWLSGAIDLVQGSAVRG